MERTLILLKPDCVQRQLIGAVVSRFEDKGLSIIAMKLMQVTPDLARQHYVEHVDKPCYPGLEGYITSGPVVAMILEGVEAIQVVRNLAGTTNGRNAAPGTIRGDYSCSRQMNLVHASGGPESAKREIEIFFGGEPVHDAEPTIRPWLRAVDED